MFCVASSDAGEDDGASLWWLWVLIGVVLVGGGVATFVIVKNKKKDNK